MKIRTDEFEKKFSQLLEEWRLADNAVCVAQHNWRIASETSAKLKGAYEAQLKVRDIIRDDIQEFTTATLQQLASLNSQETKP